MNDNPRKTHSKSFILGTVIGAAVGAALGMLYAPKKGEETRKELKGKTEELKGKAKKVVKGGHQACLEWTEEAQKAATEFSKAAQESLKEVSESVSEKTSEVIENIKDAKPRKPRYFKGIR